MEIPSKVSVFSKTLEMKGKAGTLVAINDQGFYEIVMEVQQRNHMSILLNITQDDDPAARAILDFIAKHPEH